MIVENEGRSFSDILFAAVVDCKSVLEVGARFFGQLSALPCPIKVGVEVHRPFIEHALLKDGERMRDIVPLFMDMRAMEYFFVPKSFDCVMFIDSLEHVHIHEAGHVLSFAEKLARKRVIVWTPDGFMENERPHDGEPFAMGTDMWEKHKCGFSAADMDGLGYNVVRFPNYHAYITGGGHSAIFAVKEVG